MTTATPPVDQAAAPRLPFEMQPGEHLLVFCRRHWLFLWPKTVLLGLIAVIPAAIALFIAFGVSGIGGLILGLVAIAWFVFWAIRTYFNWYRYWNDVWVVTNQRVVDSIKRHWFHHQMSSADLVDVEDMRIEKEGVLSTMFNFGNVQCQTAGVVQNFVLSDIPDPTSVLSTVDSARDAARRELRGIR